MKSLTRNLSLISVLFVCIFMFAINGIAAVEHVSGNITGDTTWSASTTYIVDADLIVDYGATLTIPAGTIVKFEVFEDRDEKVILVVDGVLDVQGTSGNPVIFTSNRDDANGGDTNEDGASSNASGGDWGFIQLNNSANDLHDCLIQYGGYKYDWYNGGYNYVNYPVWIYECSATVRDNQILYPYEIGICCQGPTGETPTISGNTIKGFQTGIYCFNASPDITGNSLTESLAGQKNYAFIQDGSSFPTYSGNTIDTTCYEAIAVTGEMISGGGTWVNVEDRSWAYLIIGDLIIGEGYTLNIPAGTIVKFKYYEDRDDKVLLIAEGILNVQGTEYYPVMFTSGRDDNLAGDTNGDANATDPVGGDWGYIKLSNSDNVFQNCIVKYGGMDYDWYFGGYRYMNTPIWIDACAAEVSNNQIISPYDIGIYCSGPIGTDTVINGNTIKDFQQGFFCEDASPLITNNKLQQSQNTGLRYPYVQRGSSFPSYKGNTIDSNCIEGIFVYDEMDSGGTWPNVEARGWPYVIIDDLIIAEGATLTIPAGTIVKLDYIENREKKVIIEVDGVINAVGTANSPIFFTSNLNDNIGGDSNGDGEDTAPAAGDWGYLRVKNSETQFTNCKFSYGGMFYGWFDGGYKYKNQILWVDGGDVGSVISPNISKCQVSKSYGDGILCDNKAKPEINGCEFTNNLIGVHCSGDALPNIIYCNIYNNTEYGVLNDDNETVTAEDNWWGHATGPSGVGSGTGDAVSDYVDYDPWLSAPKSFDEMEFGLGLTPNQTSYKSGDEITLLLSADVPGKDMTIDLIFAVLQSTTGNLYFGLTWSQSYSPTLASVTLPANLSITNAPLLPIVIPGTPPPVGMPGTYTFAIAAVDPGSLNFVSNIATVSFLVK